jgi:type IV secretory pathway component VirB8
VSGYYSKELYDLYMQEEQKAEASKKGEKEKSEGNLKKMAAAVDKAEKSAQLAFEQTQVNRFEIESLHKEIKKVKLIALIAVVIAIICVAVVLNGQMPSIMG